MNKLAAAAIGILTAAAVTGCQKFDRIAISPRETGGPVGKSGEYVYPALRIDASKYYH